MASFLNGGGDLGSTTYENALIEAMVRARVLDAALATPTNNLTDDIAASGAAITINATLPVTLSLVAGKPSLTATNFLPSAPFDPGVGGNLVSVNWPSAILELATKIQELEAAQNRNVVNVTFNADAGTATVTATMAVVRTVEADGSQKFVATPYLT